MTFRRYQFFVGIFETARRVATATKTEPNIEHAFFFFHVTYTLRCFLEMDMPDNICDYSLARPGG